GETLRPVAEGVRLVHRVTAPRVLQTPVAGAVALPDLLLGQPVVAEQDVVGTELAEQRSGHPGDRVEEPRIVVEGTDRSDLGNVPPAGDLLQRSLDGGPPARRGVLRELREKDDLATA